MRLLARADGTPHYPHLPSITFRPVLVGPCHHGMARLQVADRGTASDKEGSCEYIE